MKMERVDMTDLNTKLADDPGLPGDLYRQDILDFAEEEYNTQPEYLWKSSPDFAVLRHADNRKWYGLLMRVERSVIGLSGEGLIGILNIKSDPMMISTLQGQTGFVPAYHMNKTKWISVLLDGTVEKEQIFALLTMSYEMTASKRKVTKRESK